ncbi:MAG: hypothetical protein Q9197_005796 [Variospora fuerteventurae]
MLKANASHPSGLNEIFYYQVPGTSFVLHIRDTGDRLPLDDINACLQSLGVYILRQITIYGDGHATPRSFRHGVVRLLFTPLGITWIGAEEVVDAMEAIVINHHLTYKSHVTIEDQNIGLVGHLSIVYQAPGTVLETSTSTNSSNTTDSQLNTTVRPRPESPYDRVIPGTQITITCSGYGQALNPEAVFAAFSDALISVSTMIRQYGPLALVPARLPTWRVANVLLEVYRSERMFWFDLLTGLEGLVQFVGTYGPFAFTFVIRRLDMRSLANGQLRLREDVGIASLPSIADA